MVLNPNNEFRDSFAPNSSCGWSIGKIMKTTFLRIEEKALQAYGRLERSERIFGGGAPLYADKRH